MCNVIAKTLVFFFSYLPQFELFYIVRHILLLWIDRIRRKPQARDEYWWKRLSLLTLRVQLVKLATRHCAPNPTCIVIIVGLYFIMYHQTNYWDLDTLINVLIYAHFVSDISFNTKIWWRVVIRNGVQNQN